MQIRSRDLLRPQSKKAFKQKCSSLNSKLFILIAVRQLTI